VKGENISTKEGIEPKGDKVIRKWTTVTLGRRISVEEIEEIANKAFG